jgi:hypothetical protein
MSERIDLIENPFLTLINLPPKCNNNSCAADYERETAIAVGWNETSMGELLNLHHLPTYC